MLTKPRYITAEIMDGPNVDPSAHAEALEGLKRINTVSKTALIMADPIIALARRKHLKTISVLDIACGGGDVPIEVATIARREGIEIDLTLLDRSETALKLASAAANRFGIDCRCIQADLLDHWNNSTFDVVTCSLFLHHVPEPNQVVQLLKRMRAVSSRLVLISDLRRSTGGLIGAWIGGRMFSRSQIVHHDAVASVRAAWTLDDLREFAAKAGMTGADINACWPWRMLLSWDAEGRGE
jgi:2-polyprenyl-3-methyl-5-hydroxy-6-metoxy-1,4-benzoquinol methylase